jgi:hypothetical protein
MKDLEDLRVFSAGQTNKQLTEAYMDPVRATAGGMARKPLKEWAADTKAADEIGGRRVEQDAKLLDNVGKRIKIQGAMSGTQLSSIDTRKLGTFGQQMAELTPLEHTIDQIMSAAGISADAKGHAVLSKGTVPGVGAGYALADMTPIGALVPGAVTRLAEALEGPDAGRIRRLALENFQKQLKESTGVHFAPWEVNQMRDRLAMGAASGSQAFAQAIVDVKHMLDTKKRAFEAGAGQQVTNAYRQNFAAEAQRTQGATQGVKPYAGALNEGPNPPQYDSETGEEL